MTCYLNFEDIALGLSVHAYKRRTQRGIQQQHIAHLLRFGRKQFHRHAIYYSIGHKEINKYADQWQSPDHVPQPGLQPAQKIKTGKPWILYCIH